MKTIIERGASWTLEETKLLLALWGQDLVMRQRTNLKRTKEVYNEIASRFNQAGYERTPDQVRTRVFNMIAEYRRILKDPNPERMKKCIFFDALHKIYQAKHMDDVKSALDDYEAEWQPLSPNALNDIEYITSDNDSPRRLDEETQATGAGVNSQEESVNNTHAKGSSSGASSSSSNNNNITTNKNNHPTTETTNNSTNIDLPEEQNNGTSTDNSDLTNVTNNSSIATAASATSSVNENDSNVKHFKIRTANNEVMLLKVIDNDSTPLNKKLKLETFKACSCDQATDGKPNKTCTHQHSASSSKQQSLLLPNASSAPGTSAATASTSTPMTTKSGSGNNAYISINNTKIPIVRSNGIGETSSSNNLTSTPTRLQPTTATVASHHQLYQAPVNTFDVTSSALLIDRMFAHLSRESENMREWIALEKERLALERAKKAQETEREIRRERVLIDTLMRFQEQWISFIQRLDPKIAENAATEAPPELNIPPPQ